MGLKDIFNASKIRQENESLKELLTPEMHDVIKLQERILSLTKESEKISSDIAKKNTELKNLTEKIEKKREDIVVLEDEILVQEFGLYKPQFNFASALDYKEELAKIRCKQKELIKSGNAVIGNMNWQVNGSLAKGRKMVSDTQKLLLRAFNNECDDIVEKVKYTNFDASLNRIYKSSEAISKLGTVMSISISQSYIDAKVKELRLAFEYQQKKQEEKEAARAAREEQREQAKVLREIEQQKIKLEKEQNHYQSAYEKILKQLQYNPNDIELLNKKKSLLEKLQDIEKAFSDIDYREANMKAGYVYIISNIGAFGENVYKIGMTRRLDPQDRIDELGSASVPFKFDVHAMIFSDDAPALESALHKAFDDKKINMVNQRKEFFRVSLDEIKEVVRKNFDRTVEFIDVPDAEQYRISKKMMNQ